MTTSRRRDADAVRYVLLQKLASGIRHSLMGNLQGIQFLAELGARLARTGGEDSRLRDCVDRIPAAVAGAIATCQSVIAWLRPDEGATTTLGEVVDQSVKLAGDDWRLRGIQASVELPGRAGQARVALGAAHELVVGSLLTLADLHPGPLDLEIVGALEAEAVELRIEGRTSTRRGFLPASPSGRPVLTWDDLAVLAAAHDTVLSHASGSVTLRMALAPPAPAIPESGPDRAPR